MKSLVLPVALALALPTLGQTLIRRHDGAAAGNARGFAVAGGADFNGDGHADVVVGSPFDDVGGFLDNGSVTVFSGANGQPLVTRVGLGPDDRFGYAVALCGDIDQDGTTDFVVGAPNALGPGGRPGLVRVFSGATFNALFTTFGSADGDELGFSVAGGVDVDNDGVPDLFGGEPGRDYATPAGQVTTNGGAIAFISGATGQTLTELFLAGVNGARLGQTTVVIDDINGNGRRDFITSAPGVPGGYVLAYDYSTTGGTFGAALTGAVFQMDFGTAVGGHDFDGDGLSEVVIGSPDQDVGALTDAGVVRVIDPLSYAIERVIPGSAPGQRFGASIAELADLNSDGISEFALGSPQVGEVAVFDMLRGERLSVIPVAAGGFGASIAGGGDVNADGVPDILVGAPALNVAGNALAGSAFVFSSGPWSVAYCTAGTTSNGCNATLSATGSPSISSASGFVLRATGVEGDKSGLIFYGLSGRGALPWGVSSSYLCVKSPTQRTSTVSSGGTAGACDGVIAVDLLAWIATHPGSLGSGAAVGTIVDAQCWFRDPPSPKTTHLSNALEFPLMP